MIVIQAILGLSGQAWAHTCVAVAGGGNWSTAATWSACNSTVPQAADDVVFNSSSGNVAVDSAPNSLDSLTMTGYTGTLSGAGSITVAPASGSTAATFAGTITWTGTLNLNPANGATVTLTTNSITLNAITINGVGTVTLGGTLTTTATSALTLTKGTLNTNNQAVNIGSLVASNANTRALTLGTSTVTILAETTGTLWNLAIVTNLTFSGSSSTIDMQAEFHAPTFAGGGLTYNNVNFSVSNLAAVVNFVITGANTFANFTYTTGAETTEYLSLGASQTITGTFTVNGNSATNRAFIESSTLGTGQTITAATTSFSNVDFEDITGAGAGNWSLAAITGNSGDCGGNSGITFTSSATQYWHTTTGGTYLWSNVNNWASSTGGTGGTGRVPLPQDNVIFDANSIGAASTTVEADMPRVGTNINWTGVTNAPTFYWYDGNYNSTMYGSLTIPSGVTTGYISGGSVDLFMEGRGSSTWNSVNFNSQFLEVSMIGGTLTLQSNLGVEELVINNGTFIGNGYNVAVTIGVVSSNSSTRSVQLGSGTWTLNASYATNAWNFGTTTGLTFNAGTSTINITDTTTAAKTFIGGSLTYYSIDLSGDDIVITGSNTFNNFIVANAGQPTGLLLTSSTTQTIAAGGFSDNGSSGSPCIIKATISGTQATLSMASGTVAGNYMTLKDSNATGGAAWYAGANSTNVSNNTGWLFSNAPSTFDGLLMGGD
jgi:hypothetical protein